MSKMNKQKHFIVVVGIEATKVTMSLATVKHTNRETTCHFDKRDVWAPKPFMNDLNGRRLFEEVARQCNTFEECHDLTCIAITLPGALNGVTTLIRSSRLGIFEPIDVAALFDDLGNSRVVLLRDVDCLAEGEREDGSAFNVEGPPTSSDNFMYLFVDEGVGSTIFINGRSYRGAGYAGPIGRLIVQPDGPYNSAFRSSGTLETYLGRPSLSTNMVNMYLSEVTKRSPGSEADNSTTFRKALDEAAKNCRASDLSYKVMKKGAKADDPIATVVMDRAAHYLGLAISSVITILNPPRLVLAGGVIHHFPQLTDAANTYARRFSWEQAWNNTEINTGLHGRAHQYSGAARLALRAIGMTKG